MTTHLEDLFNEKFEKISRLVKEMSPNPFLIQHHYHIWWADRDVKSSRYIETRANQIIVLERFRRAPVHLHIDVDVFIPNVKVNRYFGKQEHLDVRACKMMPLEDFERNFSLG